MYDVISRNKTEYFIHALAKVVYGKHKNDWILVMRSRIGKWWGYQDSKGNSSEDG